VFDTGPSVPCFLDAVRWGAASVADTRLIQAPFYSGIEIESYQLDPVVRAVQMPRVSLLIADDVGASVRLSKPDSRSASSCSVIALAAC
jgi:hypothetical protein